jgi:hypothetical protein
MRYGKQSLLAPLSTASRVCVTRRSVFVFEMYQHVFGDVFARDR